MTTEFLPRLFTSDAEIIRIGEGLLDHSLPKEDWTHEAHLAATLYLLSCRPDIDLDEKLPAVIRSYNEAVGGVNSDSAGYHETITRTYLTGVRSFLREREKGPLVEAVNALLSSSIGSRDWPLRFYSKERLFSRDARLEWVGPDLGPITT